MQSEEKAVKGITQPEYLNPCYTLEKKYLYPRVASFLYFNSTGSVKKKLATKYLWIYEHVLQYRPMPYSRHMHA